MHHNPDTKDAAGKSGSNRRWYRPRNIILIALLAFSAWAGYWIYWAYTVEPVVSVNYADRMERLAAARQPPGENAWPLLSRAFDQVAAYDRLEFEVLYAEEDYVDAYPPEHVASLKAEAEVALRKLQDDGAFDLLRQAAQRPRCVRPVKVADDRSVFFIEIEGLEEARQLARARRVMLHRALENNDTKEAIAAMDDMLYLGQAFSRQPFLIDHLVGHAIVAMAHQTTRRAIVENDVDPAIVRGWLEIWQQRTLGPITIALECERLAMHDSIQRTHSDDGDGDGTYLPAAELTVQLMSGHGGIVNADTVTRMHNLAGPFYASRAELTAEADRLYDELKRLASTPAGRRADFNPRPAGWRYRLLDLLMPALQRTLTVQDHSQMFADATRLMLALALYYEDHGEYPATLAELTPQYLPGIPTDASNGQPFGYRVLEQPDQLGRGYLLYSFGHDRTDNAGTPPPANGNSALAPAGQGYDQVFNALED